MLSWGIEMQGDKSPFAGGTGESLWESTNPKGKRSSVPPASSCYKALLLELGLSTAWCPAPGCLELSFTPMHSCLVLGREDTAGKC